MIWWAKSPHLVERPGPVGVPAGVADVDEVLAGQQVDQRPRHGEPAEPAVEHPDGRGSTDRGYPCGDGPPVERPGA